MFEKTRPGILATVGMLFLVGAGASAHHDVLSDIDIGAPVEVTGQVERLDWQSPHSILTLRLTRQGQADQVWTVQLDSPGGLAENAFGERAVHADDWVRVLLYPSLQDDCSDNCFGYGLSLTTEAGNTYTLRRDVRTALTAYLRNRD